MENFNSSKGAISRLLLILAVVLLVVIVGIFVYLRFFAGKISQQKKTAEEAVQEQKPPEPVYDTTVGNIRFILESSRDLGDVLVSPTKYQKDLTTTERFIRVEVGAQNKGKTSTVQGAWAIGNIVDSEGRNFVPITKNTVYFLPKLNPCGAPLKPEFEPVSCTMLYEVSKASEGLKLEVKNTKDKTVSKKQKYHLDLNLE